MEIKKPIRSFRDLDVYQNTYKAAIEVITKIIPIQAFNVLDQV